MSVKIAKASQLKFAKKKPISIYQPFIDKMQELKPGEDKAVIVPAPTKVETKVARARLHNMLQSTAPKPPAGWTWSLRTLENGSFAIMLKKEV